MKKRNYNHFSPLDKKLAWGDEKQNKLVNSIEEQVRILKEKNCKCKL